MSVEIYHGDCRDILPYLGDVDAVVTDPPYGLDFMGKGWDHGVPGREYWEWVLDAMKPGAHLLAFGGTRTFHRLTCAIEDAGFEIRDCLMWVYGTGFPKSLDVSKAIDKAAGVDRTEIIGTKLGRPGMSKDGSNQSFDSSVNTYGGGSTLSSDITAPATDAAKQWDGWGTALKPAWEPIILARRPLKGTVVQNVTRYGCGGLNVDGCRVGIEGGCRGATKGDEETSGSALQGSVDGSLNGEFAKPVIGLGRWPANVIHDGSDEVVGLFPVSKDGVAVQRNRDGGVHNHIYGSYRKPPGEDVSYGGGGSASRFFYCAKTSKKERGEGNDHPTVKPLALMRYLCRLVTPPDGVVLDPFMGSGSTLHAARSEGFRTIGIDIEKKYCEIAAKRLESKILTIGSSK